MASEKLQLEYLARSPVPLWGGHLQRGEPVTDGDMKRWIDSGWIDVRGREGYVLTVKGWRILPTLK